jgi:hypothetical protein
MKEPVNEPLPTVPVTPFSEGIDPMTDNEQMIAQAIARAFETLSERLSKELPKALIELRARPDEQLHPLDDKIG